MPLLQRLLSQTHRGWYRALGGRMVGRIGRAPVLLLTTTGAKTGRRRETPLLYIEDGDDVVVVASNGGRPHHPAWYRNLEAGPQATVRRGRRIEERVARTATAEEKARLWPKATAVYKTFDRYVEKTDREIPMVVLSVPED